MFCVCSSEINKMFLCFGSLVGGGVYAGRLRRGVSLVVNWFLGMSWS